MELVEADGARLPFASGGFDLVVSNLGVNNFALPGTVLEECRRVLRDDGTLALSTNLRGCLAEVYAAFDQVLAASGWSARYGLRLARQERERTSVDELVAQVEAAGFRIRSLEVDSFAWTVSGGAALFRHSLVRFGFLPGWRRIVDPADEPAFFADAERRLDRRAAATDGLRLTVPRTVLLAGCARRYKTAPAEAPHARSPGSRITDRTIDTTTREDEP